MVAADKAAKLERCTLGGATDIKPKTREGLDTRAKFEDAGLNPETASKWQLAGTLGGTLGGATEIKPKTRKDPATRAKFIDNGLDPDTGSKQAFGGKTVHHSAWADESEANFQCPNCSRLYFYTTPLEKNCQKRKHQRCGGKSQVLVRYP
jgi:hypothetical protein